MAEIIPTRTANTTAKTTNKINSGVGWRFYEVTETGRVSSKTEDRLTVVKPRRWGKYQGVARVRRQAQIDQHQGNQINRQFGPEFEARLGNSLTKKLVKSNKDGHAVRLDFVAEFNYHNLHAFDNLHIPSEVTYAYRVHCGGGKSSEVVFTLPNPPSALIDIYQTKVDSYTNPMLLLRQDDAGPAKFYLERQDPSDYTAHFCFKCNTPTDYTIQHIQRHFNTRDCICDICGQSFKRSHGLRRHLETEHGE